MIDIHNLFLLHYLPKINFENGIFNYEIISILFIILFLNFSRVKTDDIIDKIINKIYQIFEKNNTTIDIIGWEFMNNSSFVFEYPHNMIAINYYVYSNNKSTKFRYFNHKKNGVYYQDDREIVCSDYTPNYILNDVKDIQIYDDIYISVNTNEKSIEQKSVMGSAANSTINTQIIMKLKSYRNDTTYIQNFINNCIISYDRYISDINKDKIYHFIYQGKIGTKLTFSTRILSDYANPEYLNYETFDCIFHSNKDKIIKDIDRLKDIEYYRKTGLKRKKGYMFYGQPGTGKTSTVMAISNYDKRHIIEVPLNRVKTNNELEAIMNLHQINNIKFKPDNIIILFDEIDVGINLNKNDYKPEIINTGNKSKHRNDDDDDNDDNEYVKISTNDKLSFGTLLSRLDGIGNYYGLIMIATTNSIKNIDESLYRDGRLSLIEFNYASANDIKNIIEYYYSEILSKNSSDKLKLLDNKISHAKLRYRLEEFTNPIELINNLLKLNNETDNEISKTDSESESASTSETDSELV